MPETTKKAVVSAPARVKLMPKSAISQGKSEGMTRWKKCEVAWAKPTRDITRKSPARVGVADASMSGESNLRALSGHSGFENRPPGGAARRPRLFLRAKWISAAPRSAAAADERPRG